MFTQQANSLLSAFSNFADPGTSNQLLQAFANCNQALVHRGGVSLQKNAPVQRGGVLGDSPWLQIQGGGNYYGAEGTTPYDAYRPGNQWANSYPQFQGSSFYNTSQLFEFGPNITVNNSPWYTRLGDTNTFDFSTRLGDVINNYGGPTFNVEGDSYFDNSVTNNQTVNNQNVTNQNVNNQTIENNETKNITIINNAPDGAGPAGAPGTPGDPGRAGADGQPGGIIWVRPDLRERGDFLVTNGQIVPTTKSIEVVTGATFDPETCQIQLSTSVVNYVSSVSLRLAFSRLRYYGP